MRAAIQRHATESDRKLSRETLSGKIGNVLTIPLSDCKRKSSRCGHIVESLEI
ncbi:hypothetical protein GCM10027343_26100 [Noviherbaspirillum agri]